MTYRQRDIVLIPIPFSDLKARKKRPVVVVSNDFYNQKTEDMVVVAITSNIQTKEYSILITQDGMEVGTLPRESMIRVDKIYNLSQSIVIKKFARLKKETFEGIINLLSNLIKPEGNR